jgi:hypothetical protein
MAGAQVFVSHLMQAITVQKLHLLPIIQYGGLKVKSADPDEWVALPNVSIW